MEAQNEPKYDWSRFVKRVNLNTDERTAYRLWATREGLEKWFLRNAIFKRNGREIPPTTELKAGDEYEWYWHGWTDDMVEKGTILEANGRDLLRFSFGKAGEVTIRIKSEQGQLIIELLQEKIPLDEHSLYYFHLGCSTGWVFYLTNMKSILEGGPDLRNRNADLKNVITA